MSCDTKAIRAGLARYRAQIESELLEGFSSIEDALSGPRFTLYLAIKSVDGLRLGPDPSGIELIGSVQKRMAAMLREVDSVLPRTSHEITIKEARPVLIRTLDPIQALLIDLKEMERFLSPMAMWN